MPKRNSRLKIAVFAALTCVAIAAVAVRAERERELAATAKAREDLPGVRANGTLLPNGWVLHPAGRQIPTGDLPLAMQFSPDDGHLLVTTGGYDPCQILAIDTTNEQLDTTQTVDQLWQGMAFSGAGNELWVSGGGRGHLWRFKYEPRGGDLVRQTPLAIEGLIGRDAPAAPRRPAGSPAPNAWLGGIAASKEVTGPLYILNTQKNTLLAVDPTTGKVSASAATGDKPTAVALSPDGTQVWVTNEGSAEVTVFAAGALTKIGSIPVGKQPVALLFSKDGSRLFVANSGGNTISVIDPATRIVRETIRTTLFPDAPTGSTPNALAVSPDGKRLFVTNADNNDVAVIDISEPAGSKVLGFIPTGWYPTTVAVSPDGKKLFVGVGKGMSSKPSYPRLGGGVRLSIYNKPGQSYGPNHDTPIAFDYVASLLSGAVSIIDMPNDEQLAEYTKQVVDGCPYRDSLLHRTEAIPAKSVIPSKVGEKSPIQHIVYIIKENRTYDQVFGDMKDASGKPIGNGDPNLVLFGENVTPNHHALAREFVLLDNLYCNAEVSEDGHQWSNAAIATDWTQKVYPGNYATPSRGDAPGDEEVTASAGGYLWDSCKAHGLTYRTYGEFSNFHSDKDSAPVASSASPALRGHVSLPWELASRQGKRRDYLRMDAFIEEMHEAEKTGDWPNYMVMALPEDHTTGLIPGTFTPWAAVASNDLAVGRLVDAVSHSKFWASTAIFIIEDDAQAGPDHVDSHRTVGLVISPYIHRHTVDHTLYSTASLLRTMELTLGLPPMTQYDAGATPLTRSFGDKLNLKPYTSIPARVDLAATNPKRGEGATASLKLDFSDIDRADPDALNHILWKAIRPHDPYPGTTTIVAANVLHGGASHDSMSRKTGNVHKIASPKSDPD